jgi:hypothetical protein
MLKALAQDIPPEGTKVDGDGIIFRPYINRAGSEKFMPVLDYLPQPFQNFIREIFEEFEGYAKKVVDAVRWRCNILGPHNAIEFEGDFWLFEGDDYWYTIPRPLKSSSASWPYLNLTAQALVDIQDIIKTRESEQISHNLFREAWSQRKENPRSALLIGIAAGEVGFKNFVETLVPENKWLIENIPSPPLERMLKDYLPILPVKLKIRGKEPQIPMDLLETLKKGIFVRNKTTHSEDSLINYEILEKILLAVHDLLWILDFFSGSEWALEYIQPKTRSLLEAN